MEITKLPIKKAAPKRRRVAAYARVSRDSDTLLHSLANQVSYYTNRISSKPEWEFAGIYVDEGISGTSVEKRIDFLRMMADARAGKIDLILTKSVSRFARNTVDLLRSVRELQGLGIEVSIERRIVRRWITRFICRWISGYPIAKSYCRPVEKRAGRRWLLTNAN